MDTFLTVSARLIDKTTKLPLRGKKYLWKLYDKDLSKDDYLGEAHPDSKGHVQVKFRMDKIRSMDSPTEKYPDLYFELYRNQNKFYQSQVIPDFDMSHLASFDVQEGATYDMGTFAV